MCPDWQNGASAVTQELLRVLKLNFQEILGGIFYQWLKIKLKLYVNIRFGWSGPQILTWGGNIAEWKAGKGHQNCISTISWKQLGVIQGGGNTDKGHQNCTSKIHWEQLDII